MTDTQLYQLIIRAEKSLNAVIADLLENLTPEPVSVSHFEEVEDISWATTAHYEIEPNSDVLSEQIQSFLDISSDQYEIEISKVENIDWVSHVQKGLKPVKAGRFFVHGSHDKDKAETEPFPILIDAAQAFGTAHHGTTKGCLNAIDELSTSITPQNILDLGAGSGILAIAAAMVFPKANIIASDIDPIAVDVAKSNDEINHPNNLSRAAITHLCVDGLNDNTIQKNAPFDLLIANILAKPLIAMAPEITKAVATNGTLLLSGILDVQSDDVVKAYEAAGMQHIKTNLIKNWTTSLFMKPE